MAQALSLLGAIHTLLSVPPVAAGLYGFARFRRIEPGSRSGIWYLAGLTLSVLSAFGLSSTGKLGPGHALGVLALAAAFGGVLAGRLRWLGAARPYLSVMGLSFSFFLLLVPGINETLSRLPVSNPVGAGIDSPAVRTALLAWVAVFLAGLVLQLWNVWRTARRQARLGDREKVAASLQ